MFNPFITPGQLQLRINQEITRSLGSQSLPSMPGPGGIQNPHNCNQGMQPLMTAALGQLLLNAFKNH
jgi:hypothetical protein